MAQQHLPEEAPEFFGWTGARSDNWQTPLLNEARSYSRFNDYRCYYQWALTDELWEATIQRLEYEQMFPPTRFPECYQGAAGR